MRNPKKSCLKLYHSSETVIKPGKSKVYLRLIAILYLCTIGLVLYSSLPVLIEGVLIFLIVIQFKNDVTYQSACQKVKEIKYLKDLTWSLETIDGTTHHYDKLKILIHNMLFQVIQLSSDKKNQMLILFNDQIPTDQLRLLHLNSN
ncbi:TPA: lpg1578 family Dot/Icm T4SS effector, partial [Legionella pneumophila]